jgi:diguanylate cyclase (GGDEF)-like protein
LLLIYLIYTGGVNNTGPLWVFLLPPVTLFLHGLKRGLIDLACFLAIMCAMFFTSDYPLIATSYDPDFTSRLILSFLTVTFLSAFYEYSREASYKKTLEISQEFERLAKKDALTKLSNRRDAMDKLEYEYSRMKRTNQPFTVLLCDIDHFKSINDNYGHDVGDKALVAIASLFQSLIRAQDTVARWGGEEFIFLLPQTSLTQAQVFADKLHLHLSQMTISTEQGDVSCTLSAGLCQSENKLSISEILKKADNALYLAKNNGRNRTEAHTD